jgi:hypothetical protein
MSHDFLILAFIYADESGEAYEDGRCGSHRWKGKCEKASLFQLETMPILSKKKKNLSLFSLKMLRWLWLLSSRKEALR